MFDHPDFADVKHGPLAKAGPLLIQVFLEHREAQARQAPEPFVSTLASSLWIEGEAVGVQVRASTDPDYDQTKAFLQAVGFREVSADPGLKIIEGLLPIKQLPAAADSDWIVGLAPIVRPVLRG